MINLGLIAFSVVVIDRMTKYFFLNILSHGRSIEVIPGIFRLTLVENTGSAFGLFRDQAHFFIVASTLVMVLILFYAWRYARKKLFLIVTLGLILGGAIGNLIDRVSFGYVIDFFDFRVWPVFNVADSAITAGVTLLAINVLFGKK